MDLVPGIGNWKLALISLLTENLQIWRSCGFLCYPRQRGPHMETSHHMKPGHCQLCRPIFPDRPLAKAIKAMNAWALPLHQHEYYTYVYVCIYMYRYINITVRIMCLYIHICTHAYTHNITSQYNTTHYIKLHYITLH